MLPFIDIFGLKLPMYGLMMMTGMITAITGAVLRSKKRGFMWVDILLCSLFCFLGGLLGAKLLYIITDIPNMVAYCSQHGFDLGYIGYRIANSGIVFYGGLLGGLLGGLIYVKLFSLSYWRLADELVVWLPLGHGFGRLGCFFAGCCYGREMARPWGVYFSDEIVNHGGVPHFPVQLLESCFCFLVLFPTLLIFARKKRRTGQVIGLYLVIYGVFRFLNEYLRADEIRGIFFGISTSQWISMLLVPLGIALLCGMGEKIEMRGGRIVREDGFVIKPEKANSGEAAEEAIPDQNTEAQSERPLQTETTKE